MKEVILTQGQINSMIHSDITKQLIEKGFDLEKPISIDVMIYNGKLAKQFFKNN